MKKVILGVILLATISTLLAMSFKSDKTEAQETPVFSYGWTNCETNVYSEPDYDSIVYCTYDFNSCVYYSKYSDDFVKIVYYDSNIGEQTYGYVESSAISDTECQEMTTDPKDMIGTGMYLVDSIPAEWNGYTCDIYSKDGDFIGEYIVGEDEINFDGSVYVEVF